MVFLALLSFSLAFVILGWRRGWVQFTRRGAIAFAMAVIPFAVWFMSAPDPRFGMGQLAGMSISPLFFMRLDARARGETAGALIKWFMGVGALIVVSLAIVVGFRHADVLGGLDEELAPTPTFPLVELNDVDGVTILTPTDGYQCGRVKWCTPASVDDLRIDDSSGWMVLSRSGPS
jgi:hypothetical protein